MPCSTLASSHWEFASPASASLVFVHRVFVFQALGMITRTGTVYPSTILAVWLHSSVPVPAPVLELELELVPAHVLVLVLEPVPVPEPVLEPEPEPGPELEPVPAIAVEPVAEHDTGQPEHALEPGPEPVTVARTANAAGSVCLASAFVVAAACHSEVVSVLPS